MAIALVAHTGKQGTQNTVTTTGINTTGANLIVIGIAFNTGNTPTIADSLGNTWTALTTHAHTGDVSSKLYYCINPTVGASQTFSNTGSGNYCGITVAAFSGAATGGFDQQNGANGNTGNTLATGSVTPGVNNELVISHFAFNDAGLPVSVNDSLTITDSEDFASGASYGTVLAYIVQTTAAAINPTWTRTNSADGMAASIATFKASGNSYSQTLTESLTLSDTLIKMPGKSLLESLVLSDNLAKAISRTLADTLTLSANVLKSIGRLFAESLFLSDNLSKQTGKSLSEHLTLSDALPKQTGKNLTESIALSDSISKQIGKTLTETISFSDAIAKSISRTFTETISLTDTVAKFIARTLTEEITMSDVLTAIKTGGVTIKNYYTGGIEAAKRALRGIGF